MMEMLLLLISYYQWCAVLHHAILQPAENKKGIIQKPKTKSLKHAINAVPYATSHPCPTVAKAVPYRPAIFFNQLPPLLSPVGIAGFPSQVLTPTSP